MSNMQNAPITPTGNEPNQGNANKVVPETMSTSSTEPEDFSSSLDDILSRYHARHIPSVSEAAGIPLPESPAPASPGSTDDPNHDESIQPSHSPVTTGKDPNSSSSSKMFDAEDISPSIDQQLEIVEILKSRVPTMTPGAYPESEVPEETSVRTPSRNSKVHTPDESSLASDTEQSRTNDTQPHRSVSIALPDSDVPDSDATRDMTDSKLSNDMIENLEAHRNKVNEPEPEYEKISEGSELEDNGDIWDAPSDHQTAGTEENNRVIRPEDTGTSSERKPSLKPQLTTNRDETSPAESLNSSALSALNSDKTGAASSQDHESLVASDGDTSSLKPLLALPNPSSTSSETVGLQDDDRSADSGKAWNSPVKELQEPPMESHVVPEDLYSLSTITSSRSSVGQEEDKAKVPAFPSLASESSEQNTSPTAASHPPPKITVEEATEVDEPPGPPVPDSTPVLQSTPKRRASFLPLGESPEPRKAVKLPMKKSTRCVRKARQVILRQPILDALLGRQMGAQVKPALKRLADGEFIAIELSQCP